MAKDTIPPFYEVARLLHQDAAATLKACIKYRTFAERHAVENGVLLDEGVWHVGDALFAEIGNEILVGEASMQTLPVDGKPGLMNIVEALPEVLEPEVARDLYVEP